MGFPEVPELKNKPTFRETIINLLDAIAMEEIAISNLLNAEAEKMQAFVGKCLNFPSNPSNQEIVDFNNSVKQLTDTLLMKEWLLLKKLETVTNIKIKNQSEGGRPNNGDNNKVRKKGKKLNDEEPAIENKPPWDISESVPDDWRDQDEGEEMMEGEE